MSFTSHIIAVDRIQKRLHTCTSALNAAGIPYAVVGGNAVAAWVGRVDPGATRATKDVDILVRRVDVPRVTAALAARGFVREDLRDIVLFLDPGEPSRKSGIKLAWASERLRPSYTESSPDVTESERDPEGFVVVSLVGLLRMKLTSFRDIDRVHIADMLSVGLITDLVRAGLPGLLLERLGQIERSTTDE